MSGTISSPFTSRLSVLGKLPRPGLPIRLRGRLAFVEPTRHGLIYFGMLVALLIGSINHNNNLGYLLTFLLGSMALVSVFHTYRNLLGFEIVSIKANPVYAGENAVFHVTLMAKSRTHPGVVLSFPGGESVTVDIGKDVKQTFSVLLNTERRGLLNLASLKIATSYPLLFFTIRATVKCRATCLVYPEPASGPLVTLKDASDQDSEGDLGGAGVEDFSSLAVYQRGDPLQHISWKAYSRGQGVYTKKFEGQQGEAVYFSPDALAGKDIELKLSRICFMIIKAEALRLAYGLKLGGKVIPPGFGGSHKRRCLRELALFDAGG